MNNEPGKVIAKKRLRDVYHVTSVKKKEAITVVARYNAEGNLLLPCCIFKEKRKKPEFEDDMPPGSHFGSLLNATWSKADTVGNDTSANVIYPFNPQAIFQHMFAVSDGYSNDTAVASPREARDMLPPSIASNSKASEK
ncbi:hypothetical protein TNCV_3735231 [Trichonephila clavipes]|nr:hypothetical protein TNCV_3735231 [Trichonephila clavipes]